MLPTLRQLHYLKLLAEHGSFSRAAEAANVTQPTLSAGVQELEKILGAPVVDRARSGVILTAVGEEAVRRAEQILAQAEDLLQAAKTAGQPLTGRFRLGVIPTIAPFLLPKALTAVRTRYPNLKLFLREDRTPSLIASLKSGALDAAIIALPYDTAGLETARIGDDELLAALPANHALVGSGPIAPDSLAGEDLILLEDGHCLRDHALGACGFDAPRAGADGGFAATSLATLVQMVGAGLGVTFLPAMAIDAGLIDQIPISIRHLDTARPNREIVLCWRARGPAEARKADCWPRCFRRFEEESILVFSSHPVPAVRRPNLRRFNTKPTKNTKGDDQLARAALLIDRRAPALAGHPELSELRGLRVESSWVLPRSLAIEVAPCFDKLSMGSGAGAQPAQSASS